MPGEPRLPELTVRGMLLGAVLTILFTVSNLYLGLKIGLTFSSVIPAAVISMAVLKMAKNTNILENNMVQSQASAAGTLPAMIFILPGMLMIGYWHGFGFWETFIISECGGCLDVLFTIPLRRAMVVHSSLAYPEGVVAAEILKVGSHAKEDGAGSGLRELLAGGLISGCITFLTSGLHVLGGSLSAWFSIGRGMTQLPLGYSTALVGAGYLIGIASGLAMLFGLLIAWIGFVPYFTATDAIPDGTTMQAFAHTVYQQKVRLIGAGAMGVAAVWTLITLTRPAIDDVKKALSGTQADLVKERLLPRTDIDMPIKSMALVFWITVAGLIGIFYAFVDPALIPPSQKLIFTVTGVTVAVIMGFFVAAACAYMAGLVGSSSSPLSGIGIVGVIVSSLVMYAVACIANDNMQDLKTGHLVGATPWCQQVSLLVGCVVGALALAPVLNLLYEAYGFPGAMPRAGMDPAQALSAPQATLMTAIAQGIFSGRLLWDYIYIGIVLGVLLVLVDVLLRRFTAAFTLPPLTVGMGIYLPPAILTPLVVGAVFGYFLKRRMRTAGGAATVKTGQRRGTLFASGLIVGESLIGILLACVIVFSVSNGTGETPLAVAGADFEDSAELLGLAFFLAALAGFAKIVRGGKAG